jgi:hypothetical protein
VESKGNCGVNGGITNRTVQSENDIAIIAEIKKKTKDQKT